MKVWPYDPEDPRCQICGEKLLEDAGEFWVPDLERSIVADAQCGLDAGLEIA